MESDMLAAGMLEAERQAALSSKLLEAKRLEAEQLEASRQVASDREALQRELAEARAAGAKAALQAIFRKVAHQAAIVARGNLELKKRRATRLARSAFLFSAYLSAFLNFARSSFLCLPLCIS